MSDEAHAPERPTAEASAPERQATFREVFAEREYRAIYGAGVFSWTGDYLAKAAVTVLVYQQSSSVALSAAAFAVSYLPWLIGGPLLTTLADRYPYRSVMVAGDAVRMALFAVIAIDGLHTNLILVLVFAATLAAPPSQAARSALLPLVLTGDRLVVGISVNSSTGQASQIGGYVAGSAIALYNPSLAMLITAGMFAVSALIIRLGVRPRSAEALGRHRSHLFRETADGFQMVFGTPVLRSIAIMVFSVMLFAIVPEGLAAAWASDLVGDGPDRGATQALIMAAPPFGFILGSLVVGRAIRPSRRLLLVRVFAVLAPLSLVPSLLDPVPVVVAVLATLSGFSVAGLMPVANGLFVRALPHGYRARAFGVMNTGVQVIQGASVLVTGVLAERFTIPRVVGLWSLAGVLLMLALAIRWPRAARFDAAIAAAEAHNATRIDPAGVGSVDRLPPGPRPPASEAGVSAT